MNHFRELWPKTIKKYKENIIHTLFYNKSPYAVSEMMLQIVLTFFFGYIREKENVYGGEMELIKWTMLFLSH